ncbi:HNH endonuclease [Streptomyces rimosus]
MWHRLEIKGDSGDALVESKYRAPTMLPKNKCRRVTQRERLRVTSEVGMFPAWLEGQRLRRRVDERGSGWCDWCLNGFPTDVVEIDHMRSLETGRTDTDGNVQVLCVGCHQLKTGTEFGM